MVYHWFPSPTCLPASFRARARGLRGRRAGEGCSPPGRVRWGRGRGAQSPAPTTGPAPPPAVVGVASTPGIGAGTRQICRLSVIWKNIIRILLVHKYLHNVSANDIILSFDINLLRTAVVIRCNKKIIFLTFLGKLMEDYSRYLHSPRRSK